jgi:hypothetical protein
MASAAERTWYSWNAILRRNAEAMVSFLLKATAVGCCGCWSVMGEAKPVGEKVAAKNVIVRMVRSAKRGTGELIALLLKSECSTARNLEFDSRCRELL